MTLTAPYLISFWIGYLTISILTDHSKSFSPLLKAALAVSAGLGISSTITFFSFILGNEFNPTVIIYLHLILFASLFFFARKKFKGLSGFQKRCSGLAADIKNNWLPYLFTFCIWVFLSHVILTLAKDQPFGQWDGWALYNMKFKFLILGETSWAGIFSRLHWHTQPDYPLLLPLMNVWVYSVTKHSIEQIPIYTAVVLTISTGILLYSCLRIFTKRKYALIASLVLLANPHYIFMATSQYADILIANYTLSALTVLILMIRDKDKRFAFLLGVICGLMTFTKNEGIVMSIIIACIGLILISRSSKISITPIAKSLLIGFLMTASATIILKLFYAPANRDILVNFTLFQAKHFNWEGLTFIIKEFFIKAFDDRWSFAGIFIISMLVISHKNLLNRECLPVTLFMCAYLTVLIFIYLTTTNSDLAWRISRTLFRIYFYLFPSVIFLSFLAKFNLNEAPGQKT